VINMKQRVILLMAVVAALLVGLVGGVFLSRGSQTQPSAAMAA